MVGIIVESALLVPIVPATYRSSMRIDSIVISNSSSAFVSWRYLCCKPRVAHPHRRLGELDDDISGVGYHLRSNLDDLLPQRRHRRRTCIGLQKAMLLPCDIDGDYWCRRPGSSPGDILLRWTKNRYLTMREERNYALARSRPCVRMVTSKHLFACLGREKRMKKKLDSAIELLYREFLND